jgi:hypothetical protein
MFAKCGGEANHIAIASALVAAPYATFSALAPLRARPSNPAWSIMLRCAILFECSCASLCISAQSPFAWAAVSPRSNAGIANRQALISLLFLFSFTTRGRQARQLAVSPSREFPNDSDAGRVVTWELQHGWKQSVKPGFCRSLRGRAGARPHSPRDSRWCALRAQAGKRPGLAPCSPKCLLAEI